jgi:probable DNA metabolism protein
VVCYVYDGTFEGLLTSIYEAYYRHEEPEVIAASSNFQLSLVSEYSYIETDETKSQKVYSSISKKISPHALENIYCTYLSEIEDAGILIYRYLKLGFRIGRSIDQFLSDSNVLKVVNTSRYVACEKHRLLGLLRFRLIGSDIYYAPVSPVNNIVPLLAQHFFERFNGQNWIIHDVKRGIAVVYNTDSWVIINDFDLNAFSEVKGELDFQELWKQYFRSIAIKGRVNPKLQMHNMPKRYWKHLIEVPGT